MTASFKRSEYVSTFHIFKSQEVAAAGSASSGAIDLGVPVQQGYFSIQVEVTGDGTLKLEYLLSNNDVDYLEPSAASDIATGIASDSGPGSNGKDIYSFKPMAGRYIKIKATETGESNVATISAWLTTH